MKQVLVVGAGSIGERHARCFQQIGRADVGVVEPRESLRAEIRNRYGLADAFSSLDEALAAKRWDSVVICTPAHTHVSLALACLAGKAAVLIEKPLAVTLRDAQTLLQAACVADVSAGVAYVYRAHPILAAMRDAILQGRFGRPMQVISVSGQHFPTYRPAYASTYFTRHETGGGTIQDALTHQVNAAQWIVGPVTQLSADVDQYRLKDTQVEDTVHMMARHGNVMAMYSHNQHQAANETTLTVVCESAMVRLSLHSQQWMWQSDPQGQWQAESLPMASRDAWFERQAHAWMDVLEGSAKPLCTLKEAFQTLAVNEAALQSSRGDRRWVDVKGLMGEHGGGAGCQ